MLILIHLEMKIAIQGEKGSFHEVAARQYFKYDEVEIIACSTFDLELITVKNGEADFAVMAIENARSGSILYNYTLIRESGMKILGEHNLRIKQNLMALPNQKITDIKEIRTHPIAIIQCMTFLNQHPGITLIESDDTAGSARQISEFQLKAVAAIASTLQLNFTGLKYLHPELKPINRITPGFLLLAARIRAIPEEIKFQYASPPAINQDRLQKCLLNWQKWILIFQKFSQYPG